MVIGLGEAAALGAAASWAACAQLFGAAGLRIGSVAVNHLRLAGGVVLLAVLHLALQGELVPAMGGVVLALFVASGIVGLVLGDAALFRAFILVGPMVATLVMTLSPGIATLEAWIFLDEVLPARAITGIIVTVCGVALTAWARSRGGASGTGRASGVSAWTLGLALACLGALGQASGVVLARPALQETSALSGTLVRMAAGAGSIWAFTLGVAAVRRAPPRWIAKARADRRALWLTLAGTLTGPVAGVWLSLVATKNAPVGVAATLMSLTPLFVMGLDALLFGRRPIGAEIVGGLVAIGGVALLVTAR